MNFFDKQQKDFAALYPETDQSTPRASNGLNGPDFVSMGLQLYGASQMDKAAEEELKRKQEEEKLALILRGKDARTSAQQFERGAAQTDRSMNMQGAQMLSEMRQAALKNRRLYSTRKAFSGAF